MKKIDLHVHTNKSDGTFSPEEVIDYASTVNLCAIAITDHDTVSGIAPAIAHGRKYGIEVVPGIEISAEWTEERDELEIHILGYYIDYQNPEFQKRLDELSIARMRRAERILEKLRSYNIALEIEDVQEFTTTTNEFGTPWIGRLHIAQAMVKKGYVPSINSAFDQYIGNNKCCYVPKHQLNPEGAIQVIKGVNGIAVFAHPGLLEMNFADSLIRRLEKCGLDGIEVYYPEHTQEVTRHLEEMARANNLLITGGTDCHGLARGRIMMGTLEISYELLEKLKERKNKAGL